LLKAKAKGPICPFEGAETLSGSFASKSRLNKRLELYLLDWQVRSKRLPKKPLSKKVPTLHLMQS
jgi:hypothetical protein